jgi:acetylornithine deacetylase/succinyl-diaminopimelate desuccinylase-like protein
VRPARAIRIAGPGRGRSTSTLAGSAVYGALCENAHGFDERVELASLCRVTGALALFIAEWCGVDALSPG